VSTSGAAAATAGRRFTAATNNATTASPNVARDCDLDPSSPVSVASACICFITLTHPG
jgi:hypothetical protein